MVRTEKDSFGEKEVPVQAYFGIHTTRSLENFSVAGEPLPIEIIYGMVKLKKACALANESLGLLDKKKAVAIINACDNILKGGFEKEFPIDIFQAGSGTSSNMNVNEVIANLACKGLGGQKGDRSLVHPNDDVNKGQSTNNIFPSGVKVAASEQSLHAIASLERLAASLRKKAEEFSGILKSGRTHLQDAVPITLGQEFAAYARAIEKDLLRIKEAREKCLELGVGGNAVGTGVNTKPQFRNEIIKALNQATGEYYAVAKDGIEATQFLTDLAGLSSALRLTALDILKIVNDLRLLSSGPNTGFGELALPAVEPGSSIMPGKINPSICEAANMACMQVLGNDHCVAIACGAGQLELNTHMPLVGTNLVKSLRILSRCPAMLAEKCIEGITANEDVCKKHFEWSAGLATILNPKLGYDRVAELVKQSLKEKKNLRQLAIEKGILTEAEYQELAYRCTGPNL